MLDQHLEIDPAMSADIAKFEVQLARYRAGDLAEDAFRVWWAVHRDLAARR